MPSSEGGIDYLPFAQTNLRKKSNRIPLEVQAAVRIQLVLTKELYGMIEYFQQKPVIGSLQGESRKPDFPSKARFNQACLGRIPAGGSHTSRRAVINSTAITGITTLPVRRMFSSSRTYCDKVLPHHISTFHQRRHRPCATVAPVSNYRNNSFYFIMRLASLH